MTNYLEIAFDQEHALELSDFKNMDYYAVNTYQLPIELMMENAGLHLATVIANRVTYAETIKIGVGNGNNGGGGLVAARRLAAWGYKVTIASFTEITRPLPALQLQRAKNFGVQIGTLSNPDVWVDAYLGFSQRLPLSEHLASQIQKANNSNCTRIALDIPTGFLGDTNVPYFRADTVISLAAPKKILYQLPHTTTVLVADLGIPKQVYQQFGIAMPPFGKNHIIKLKR